MKKLYVLLALMLCAMMIFSAQAAEAVTAVPGDTITVPISVESQDACMATLSFNVDTNVFELKSVTSLIAGFGSVNGGNGRITLYNGNIAEIVKGEVAEVTLVVKETAKGGTYDISVKVEEAWTLDEDYATATAKMAPITVDATCAHENTEVNVVDADCVNDGEKQTVCADCGEVLETEIIDKLGHDFGEYYLSKAATCTEMGEETSMCSRCEEKQVRVEIEALGHSFGIYEETVAATCTEKGEETAQCVRCDVEDTRELPALGHTEVKDEAVEATCTQTGKTEGSHCSVCEVVLVAQETIPMLEHEWKEGKPANCTDEGIKICEKCGSVEKIPALGEAHDEGTWVVVTEATEEAEGLKELRCTVCGFVLDTEVIPKLDTGDDRLSGDVNGDGKVNGKDLLLLAQYNAELPVEINLSNSDVNADGKVNGKDLLLLAQYNAEIPGIELK